LAEVRQLILSGEVAKLRMALVAVDNLAEVVLHRHKRLVLRIANDSWRDRVPRWGQRELTELNRDFGARVELARGGGSDSLVGRVLRPLLDDPAAATFRTGHAYRGRVYHADHHNPAVLPLITRAYMLATARAFVAQPPTGVGSSVGVARRRLFTAYGYEGSDDPFMPGMFVPGDAARTIVDRLTDGFHLEVADAMVELRSDLDTRTEWADEMIRHLLEDGMPPDRLVWSLRWSEFWETKGTDDEIVRLTRELADTWNARVEEGPSDDVDARFGELNEERNARVSALWRDFKPKFDLREISRIRRLAARLASARDVGALFVRYHALDKKMELIEHVLDEAAIGWDKYVELQVDASLEE
jgi:hypothetical protein